VAGLALQFSVGRVFFVGRAVRATPRHPWLIATQQPLLVRITLVTLPPAFALSFLGSMFT